MTEVITAVCACAFRRLFDISYLDWIGHCNMPTEKVGRLWSFKVSEVDAFIKSGVAVDK